MHCHIAPPLNSPPMWQLAKLHSSTQMEGSPEVTKRTSSPFYYPIDYIRCLTSTTSCYDILGINIAPALPVVLHKQRVCAARDFRRHINGWVSLNLHRIILRCIPCPSWASTSTSNRWHSSPSSTKAGLFTSGSDRSKSSRQSGVVGEPGSVVSS